jgi:hypothetical protein
VTALNCAHQDCGYILATCSGELAVCILQPINFNGLSLVREYGASSEASHNLPSGSSFAVMFTAMYRWAADGTDTSRERPGGPTRRTGG